MAWTYQTHGLSYTKLSIVARHVYRPILPISYLTFTHVLPCRVMPPRRSSRVNRGVPPPRGGRTGGRGGRAGGRGTGGDDTGNETPDVATIIAQQLRELLPTIVTQVGDHMSNQGNNVSGNNQADKNGGSDHVNDGNHNNGNRGCNYKEFTA